MSLDDRLRTGLTRDHAYRPAREDEVLSDVMARAGRRRRLRGLAIAAAAAVVIVFAAAVVPWALQAARTDGPVVAPTEPDLIDDWSPPNRSTPLDAHTWRSGNHSRATLLEALDGTGMARFGTLVYSRASMREAFSEVDFAQGNFVGVLQSHSRGTQEVLPGGTFRIRGHDLVITFRERQGQAVFRWAKPDRSTLVLRFVRTSAPPLYGAPAEVFLRMWSAAPFVSQ